MNLDSCCIIIISASTHVQPPLLLLSLPSTSPKSIQSNQPSHTGYRHKIYLSLLLLHCCCWLILLWFQYHHHHNQQFHVTLRLLHTTHFIHRFLPFHAFQPVFMCLSTCSTISIRLIAVISHISLGSCNNTDIHRQHHRYSPLYDMGKFLFYDTDVK